MDEPKEQNPLMGKWIDADTGKEAKIEPVEETEEEQRVQVHQ